MRIRIRIRLMKLSNPQGTRSARVDGTSFEFTESYGCDTDDDVAIQPTR